jgi:hypothetical protein
MARETRNRQAMTAVGLGRDLSVQGHSRTLAQKRSPAYKSG